MKLVVTHYLRSLRERDELDAILPDLLSETGYVVLTRPRRGTRQAGVDIAAIGPDPDRGNRRSLFLLTVKSGDLTRAHWDGGQQAVRASLNEILDDYIPNRIPPQFRDLPVVVCVCMGGEMREDIRAQWSGFCQRHEAPELRFVEWNGEHIADILLSGVLRTELVDERHRGIFQKALAMLDQPDVAYRHFHHLVASIFESVSEDADVTRRLRRSYICLWILFVWARDSNNLEAAFQASELVLLRTWPHCDPRSIATETVREERRVHLDQVLRLYLIVGRLLLVDKVGPFVNRRFALSLAVNSRNANDVNIAMFRTLGRFSLHGIWLHHIATQQTGDFASACHTEASEALDLAIGLINANPTLSLPICDEFAIEIALFLHLAHLRGRLKGVAGYVVAMGEHLISALRSRDGYPTASTDYRVVVGHVRERSDAYFEEQTRASVLYPLLLTWLFMLDEEPRCERLRTNLLKYLPHTTYQVWIPNQATDRSFWNGGRNHGVSVTDLAFDESMQRMFQTFDDLSRQYPITEMVSAVAAGLYPLILTACRHYRMPVPLQLWKGPEYADPPCDGDGVGEHLQDPSPDVTENTNRARGSCVHFGDR